MSKLYLYYGAMGSAKSLDLLRTAYNYVEGGKKVLLMTSSVDDRAGVGIIESRVGISEKSVYVYKAKPEFQEYLSQLCKERFRAMEALAIKKLNEEINKNNFKAIQYLLDGLGYKAKEQQEIQMEAKIEVDYGED